MCKAGFPGWNATIKGGYARYMIIRLEEMRKIAVLLICVVCIVGKTFAKKDLNAWKNEQTLEKQYDVFIENLNFWNGSYFLKPDQMKEFYAALTDTVQVLENQVSESSREIRSLQKQLSGNEAQTREIQEKLDLSIKNQESISLLGIMLHKNTYSLIMSTIIVGLLVLLGIVFLMFKRSHNVTAKTKKDYEELKEEFETHRKTALDRYTKINMELHQTRLQLNKK